MSNDQAMRVVPLEPIDKWYMRVAVLARVWPEDDADNVPAGIVDAIRRYHLAMLSATPQPAGEGRGLQDSWERVCVALGEHVDTDIERIIEGIEHLRAQCREPASVGKIPSHSEVERAEDGLL